MAAESDLYAKLSGAAAVTAIVGTRIYSDIPDEADETPYIYYERTNTEMINTIHSGVAMAEISDFAVVCWAETREAAEDLGDKAMLAVATDNTFVYTGRQGEYDPDARLFAAAILLQHNL